ncbi:MAG: HIT domain-containing protein [Candidatus Omnitrophica bacterium]|nr:HIT domain-containing protein [Candidatus Omnitrophota bacterium]
MEKLWAPWRAKYAKSKKTKGCIFCLKPKSKSGNKEYIVTKGRYVFSMLNIYPYNNGHIMVAPYRHIQDLDGLDKEEALELMEMINKSINLLKAVLKPSAFNIGINIGSIAGAGYAEHLHVHIVPRWQGDTNFMPIIAKTKVVPEALDELYKRLKDTQKKHCDK